MYFSQLHRAVGLDILLDQSSSSSEGYGQGWESSRGESSSESWDSIMGMRSDLEMALSGVRRPRSCSAVCGAERVARRGVGERMCWFVSGRLLRRVKEEDGMNADEVGDNPDLCGAVGGVVLVGEWFVRSRVVEGAGGVGGRSCCCENGGWNFGRRFCSFQV